jgi:hypothetical protein
MYMIYRGDHILITSSTQDVCQVSDFHPSKMHAIAVAPYAAFDKRNSAGRNRPASFEQRSAGCRVSLPLSINSTNVRSSRRMLRAALGELAQVLTVSIDAKKHRICFHICASRGALEAIMTAVISSLPEAEFGPVRELH